MLIAFMTTLCPRCSPALPSLPGKVLATEVFWQLVTSITVRRFPSHSAPCCLIGAILAVWRHSGPLAPTWRLSLCWLLDPLLAARLAAATGRYRLTSQRPTTTSAPLWPLGILTIEPTWLFCALLITLTFPGYLHPPCHSLSIWFLDSLVAAQRDG